MSACSHKNDNNIVITPLAEQNHLQRNHLKGKVKTVITDNYIVNSEDSSQIKSNTHIQEYSSDGFLTAYITLNKEGDTLSKRIINYNDKAQETIWIEKNYQDNQSQKCIYNYDINNYKSSEYYYLNDSLLYHIDYKTDGIGGITEMKRVYSEYNISNKFSYNALGLVTQINEYDPQGNLYKFITIEYDNYGDEINRCAYKDKNNLIEYTYTQYDKNGLLMRILYEDPVHSIREERLYADHDKSGNWITEKCNRNKKNIYIRNRTIIYY